MLEVELARSVKGKKSHLIVTVMHRGQPQRHALCGIDADVPGRFVFYGPTDRGDAADCRKCQARFAGLTE